MEVSGPLPRGKTPQYQLDIRLGGTLIRSGHGGEEEDSYHCTYRALNPGSTSRNLVSMLAELSRIPDVLQRMTGSMESPCTTTGDELEADKLA
jgi:hypothetical protein